MKQVLIIDNYDSFTYNLVHLLNEAGREVAVWRNDKFKLEDMDAYDEIVLSPGPGLPEEAGLLLDVIRVYGSKKKILGVCLGMQAIAMVYGGSLYNLPEPMHGIARPCMAGNDVLFSNCGSSFLVGRYHSWVVDKNTVPEGLEVTAVDADGELMALKHKQYKVWGVQFHPESVLTENGLQMIQNWLAQ